MISKYTLASLVFLLPAAQAFAQRPVQGFVVTAAGDTVRGELFQSESDARKQIVHLKPAAKSAVTYTAADVRAFGIPGRALVESRTYGTNRTPIFTETLVKGPVSLYKGYQAASQDPRYAQDIRYYLQLPDSSQLTLIEPKPLALSLHRLLGDCPSIDFNQRITAQPKSYNTARLKQAVSDYTACRYPTNGGTPVTSPYRGWYRSWGVKAGINRTQVKTAPGFFSLPNAESDQSSNWQAGIFGNLAYWNGFAVQAELMLVQLQGNLAQTVYSGTTLYTINRKADFKLRQVRLPLLLRYQAGHGLVRPFILVGPHVGYELSHTATINDQRSDQSTITSQPVIWPDKLAYGLQGGGGLYLALPKLPGISLEATYSRGQQGRERQVNITYRDLAYGVAVYF